MITNYVAEKNRNVCSILEVRSPKVSPDKSRHWQGCAPSRCPKEESISCLFQFLVAANILWGFITVVIKSSLSLSLKSPSVMVFRAHQIIQDKLPISRSLT
jgi:hypothetical protein